MGGEAFTSCSPSSSGASRACSTSGTRSASTTMCSASTTGGPSSSSSLPSPLSPLDDPLNRVFPKVAKCTFQKFGPSGSLQKHDVLCVLPLNIINEKIYVFLYLWFVFLAAVSGIWLVYRLLTIVSHQMRVDVIFARADRQVKKEVIHACLVRDDHSAIERLGDFLLLHQITKNVNPLIIKDIFEEIKPKSYRANSEEEQMLLKSSAPEM